MSRALLITAAIAVGLAYAAYESYTSQSGAPSAPARATREAPVPPSPELVAGDSGMPGPGDLRVSVHPRGRVTLLVNGAPRGRVLRALASHLDFDLQDYAEHRRVTVRERREPVESLLALLLYDTPYTLRYAANADGLTVLAELTVGRPPARVASLERGDTGKQEERRDARERDGRRRSDRGERLQDGDAYGDPDAQGGTYRDGDAEDAGADYTPLSEEQRMSGLAARAIREEIRREELVDDLASGDAEERRFALLALDPDIPADLALMRSALLEDPDPSVRAEAAEQLSFGDLRTVGPVLSPALDDPDSGVVIAAIDSLGFVGDQSAMFRLQKLLDHPDEAVRRAASSAILELRAER